MATVLDGLVSSSLGKLTQLLKEEILMTLYVRRDIRKLKQNLECFKAVRQDAEARAMRLVTDELIKGCYKNKEHKRRAS